jgi:hypothetical protein
MFEDLADGLDVDLTEEIIEHPEHFPLVARTK